MTSKHKKTLMLLSNGYDPDIRVEKEAKSLSRAGYLVEIMAWDRLGEKPLTESRDGITINRTNLKSKYRSRLNVVKMPMFWCKLYWKVLRSNADVIHCHDFDTFPPGFLAAKLRLRLKKVVYDAHENYGELHPKTKLFVNVFEKLFCRFAVVVTVNELIAKRYKKAVVVMNCQRLEDYKSKTPEVFTLLHVGNYRDDCQLDMVREAMSGLPDCVLKVYGKGHALSNTKNIEVCGFIKPENVAQAFCESSVVIAILKPGGNNNFSSPNKLFDAMAAGKPVLANDVGIVGDVVRKYDMGVVLDEVTPESIINGIKVIKQNYEKFASNSAKAAKDYNWDNESKKLIEAYVKMCQKV